MARWVKSHNQMRIFKQTATPAVVDGLAVGDIWIDTNSGAILKVCTAVGPVVFATDSLDASGNFSADSFIAGYATTATAAGTTTLTVTSVQQQFFTGTTTQTVTLPVASTLVTGFSYIIVNNSTGAVTVNSSGGNAVVVMAAATRAVVTCILASGTSAASWDYTYTTNASGITGTGSMVLATSPTLVTPALGTVASGVISACTSTSMALVTPKIGQINDTNGNQSLILTAAASAVNGMTLTNAASGSGVSLTATGSDANINFSLGSKGTGVAQINVFANSNQITYLTGTGADHESIFSFPTGASARTYTWPDASGTVTALGNTSTGSGSVVLATSPTLATPVLGVATATSVVFTKASGAESGNAITLNGNAGVITTSSLTTAASGSYAITWTNSAITTTSVITLTNMGGTNTTEDISFKCVPGSGTATLTIYNNVLVTTALNGTILIGYTVF